ncbi:hypothetical protein GCM10009687_56920 [Asanoa iriomotensis]
MVLVAARGGSSSQMALVSSAVVAGWPSRNSSTDSTTVCCGDPIATGRSPCHIRTGPRTPNRTSGRVDIVPPTASSHQS